MALIPTIPLIARLVELALETLSGVTLWALVNFKTENEALVRH